jgi:hypothetical protein
MAACVGRGCSSLRDRLPAGDVRLLVAELGLGSHWAGRLRFPGKQALHGTSKG